MAELLRAFSIFGAESENVFFAGGRSARAGQPQDLLASGRMPGRGTGQGALANLALFGYKASGLVR